jgi:LysM repeat protein
MRTGTFALLLLTGLTPAALRAAEGTGGQATQAPAPLIDYTVRPGETLQSIAKRLYGSAARVDLILRENNLDPAAPLRPGQVLRVPQRAGPDARLTYVRNLVDAYTPERHPGQKGQPLQRGHRVGTRDRSSAEITFSDDTNVQLGENSLLLIAGEDSARGRRAQANDTTLLSGNLRAHLAELAGKLPRRIALSTPAGQVLLGPGTGLLDVDQVRTTRVAVHRGTGWQVSAVGKMVNVPQGYGTRVEMGRRPAQPRRLPAAPRWTAPPPPILLRGGQGVTVEARFGEGAGPGASPALYHVQVARDERFNDLVRDQKVPATETTLRAEGIAPGTYFARVSAIDADGMIGPAGPVARFEVAQAEVVPGAQGRRAAVKVPPGLFCGLDGAPLAPITARAREGAMLPLSPARDHTLLCAPTAEGTHGAQITIPASQCGPLRFLAQVAPPQAEGGVARSHVTLRLRDAEDGPVQVQAQGIAVRVQGSPGVTVGPLQEEDGALTTTARWPASDQSAALSYAVGPEAGAVTYSVDLPALPPPPPPPPPRPAPLLGVDLALMGTAFLGDAQRGSLGHGISPEIGLRFTLPRGSLSLGLRPAYEHSTLYGGARTSCALAEGVRCLPAPEGPYAILEGRHLLSLGLPIVYRLRGTRAQLNPYLLAVPQVLLSWLQTRTDQPNALLFRPQLGLLLAVGAQARTPDGGGLFLELGYRVLLTEERAPSESSLGGAIFLTGYRHHL